MSRVLIDLAKPKSRAPYYNKFTLLEPAIQLKTCTWAVVHFKKKKKHVTSKHEPMILSCEAGQQVPCFDRCQLNITWMPNIKGVCCKPTPLDL